MKHLRGVKRLVAILRERGRVLDQAANAIRSEIAAIDAGIERIRLEIESLRDDLTKFLPERRYTRSELMRARGSQAPVRAAVARKRFEQDEMRERRESRQRELQANRRIASALARKRDAHQEWIVVRERELDRIREVAADEDITEGAHHGFKYQQQCGIWGRHRIGGGSGSRGRQSGK